MARSNGPFGPPDAQSPLRRDSLATLSVGQPAPQWPTQAYPDQPVQAGPAYHFPPQESAADYSYNQQYAAPPQWGQPADQRGHGVASYLPADPPPFQQTAHNQQAYAEPDYADEFYEDEEPRRGRRWLLVAVALVGAIGVGGALAYTYKSLIAPGGGRVPLVKAEPPSTVKVRPEQRGGREFTGSERKLPNQGAAPPPQQAEPESPEGSAAPENVGPRVVRPIPIGPQQQASAAPASIPGITLHNPGPPRAEPKEAAPKAPPSSRVTTTTQQPAPAESAEEDDQATGPPPQAKPRPSPVAPNPPPQVAARPLPAKATAPPATTSALGYVVVVASKKTHMDAVTAYADVHEKHAQVLSGKTPAVQEADLGDKGVVYRAVVGPPVSREAAVNLCGQLKAAGQDCWIKTY